jgi:hypothetical protein
LIYPCESVSSVVHAPIAESASRGAWIHEGALARIPTAREDARPTLSSRWMR